MMKEEESDLYDNYPIFWTDMYGIIHIIEKNEKEGL